MNSIILFVGGVLLGVLLSVSLVEHISNLSMFKASSSISSASSTTPLSNTATVLSSSPASGLATPSSPTTSERFPGILIIPASAPTAAINMAQLNTRQVDDSKGTATISSSSPAVTSPVPVASSVPAISASAFSSSSSSAFRWTPGKELDMTKFKKEAEMAQSHILGESGTKALGATTTSSNPIIPISRAPLTTQTTVTTSAASITGVSATDLLLKDYPGLNERVVTKLRRREAQLLQKSGNNGTPDLMVIKQKLAELLEKRQDKLLEKQQGQGEKVDTTVAVPASSIDTASISPVVPTTPNIVNGLASPSAKTVVGQTSADSFSATSGAPPAKQTSLPSTSSSRSDYSPDSRSKVPGMPPIPYHDQALRNYSTFRPYIPTYEEAKKSGKPLPDMSRQKTEYEKDNLKMHLCNGVFEAYSASYLTTKQHMLNVQSEGFNLSWVNCEMASFIHMRESNRFYKNPNVDGLIMQTLDVLDFSAIHLSAFERSSKKHKDVIWSNPADRKTKWTNIDPVIEAGKILAKLNDPKQRDPRLRDIQYSEEAKRTVVIMPFLGGAMGAGHSELGNRFEYLKTCFWSLYEFFPFITASVTREEDVEWALKYSGLPFYDILLIKNLPKSAGLPVATTQHTKARLMSGAWDFDYVFFTESDQIIISRELQVLYDHLKKYPGHMLLPHRLMPYSYDAITKAHKRTVSQITPTDWMTQSCCLERQNCVERKTWKVLREPDVPIINYYGLYVPLGNVNFLAESYRYCKLTPYVGDYCP